MDELVLIGKSDPEANGRIAMVGDQRYILTFPLADGRDLKISVGRKCFNNFAGMIAQIMIDDDEDEERLTTRRSTG